MPQFYSISKAILSFAALALLRWEEQDFTVSVSVEDNGRGFNPAAGDDTRSGLTNMQSRLFAIGEATIFVSQPGEGTKVQFTLRLSAEAAQSAESLN